MNINFKFLLLGTSLSLIPHYAMAQCVETDCLKLGYTSLQKCDNGLKCPFGEYWACPKVEEKAVLGECTGYAKNCFIGQILNNDGTCSSDKVSGKTPIGVVVYIGGNCGYAMTAAPIQTGIQWSLEYINTGASQSSDWKQTIQDFNVNSNMTKIIQAGNSSTYPAAYAALNYAPSAASMTKGKWALPTAGILNSLYMNLNVINNTLSKIGGMQLVNHNEHIWSSSEANSVYAWYFCTGSGASGGGVNLTYKKSAGIEGISFGVRPVLAF
ncbi:MAG: hypothetical protein Q4F75_07275 [Pseudomonadota bacterium]|nr:hypothetical protein [Pseudomonadota bacterium]